MLCGRICSAQAQAVVCLVPASWGQTLFQENTAPGCNSKSHSALGACRSRADRKGFHPLALNVKLYAGNQPLISIEQSNPSALIQGFYESLLTGEAWKT